MVCSNLHEHGSPVRQIGVKPCTRMEDRPLACPAVIRLRCVQFVQCVRLQKTGTRPATFGLRRREDFEQANAHAWLNG